MKKALLLRLATLFLAISTLTGCLLVPVDDGYPGGDSHQRGRGGHRGDNRGDNHDRR